MKAIVAKVVNKTLEALVPTAVYGLGIICPVVPEFVWTALFNAIIDGDITAENLQQFLKDHNIKTYSAPEDFPAEKDRFGSH